MRKLAAYHPTIPTIPPVPDGIPRPFWSVMIPTYNCAHYLRETLESVLVQDPGPEHMQIEVVDDCSTKDDPEAVVREVGRGRVDFYRKPRNGGVTANFNTCIKRAQGQWVHILHGDDTVYPGFYASLGSRIDRDISIGAAFCRVAFINEKGEQTYLRDVERDEAGILEEWLDQIAVSQRIHAPAIVVKRKVYESVGGFRVDLVHAADWDMWKRVAASYNYWYEPRLLAGYRVHSASDTSVLMRTGANVSDIRRSILVSRFYLPEETASDITREAKRYYALGAIQEANRQLDRGDVTACFAQLREALMMSLSKRILRGIVRIILRVGVRNAKTLFRSA